MEARKGVRRRWWCVWRDVVRRKVDGVNMVVTAGLGGGGEGGGWFWSGGFSRGGCCGSFEGLGQFLGVRSGGCRA